LGDYRAIHSRRNVENNRKKEIPKNRALPYPDDFALSEQRNEIFITFVVIFRAAEPTISAAKR